MRLFFASSRSCIPVWSIPDFHFPDFNSALIVSLRAIGIPSSGLRPRTAAPPRQLRTPFFRVPILLLLRLSRFVLRFCVFASPHFPQISTLKSRRRNIRTAVPAFVLHVTDFQSSPRRCPSCNHLYKLQIPRLLCLLHELCVDADRIQIHTETVCLIR